MTARTQRSSCLGLLAVLGLAAATLPATAARGAPPGPVETLTDAPIERVVVYSDQARVYRSARVTLGAEAAPVALAALPPAAGPDTVRVECDTADIAHVEVARTWARLPRQAEGRALLARIEKAQDEVRALEDEERLLRTELGVVDALQPLTERKRPDKEPPLLFVDAWRRVLTWAEGRAAKLRVRLATFPAQRHALHQKLQALRVEGRKLLPDAVSGAALRVLVTLRGKPGVHRVTLSYVVGGVRWLPQYDLRYDPVSPSVEATYYALVTQSSGEDWREARLAFSTILPSNLLAVPELPTWTLGRTTTFTPTPRERWERRPVPWAAPAAAPAPDPTLRELEQAVGRLPADGDDEGGRRRVTGYTAHDGQVRERELQERADKTKDAIYRARARIALQRESVLTGRAEAPAAQAPRPPAEPEPEAVADEERLAPRKKAERRIMADRSVLHAAPAARRSRSSRRFFGLAAGSAAPAAPPSETVPWTDTGYRPPYLDPDLPAASAKGHRFTMDAPGRHSVVASGAPARVPLLRERFGVNPVYRIVPGRSKAAYLTAEIYNSSGRPVLRGHANLFTGATYSGQTKLETAVPGAKLLLPLGVDEGVKVNRMINQKTVSTGVFFKDEVSEYTVTIEIANHRRHAIQVEVEDQVPVTRHKDTKVEGFEASPAMSGPALDGRVTYKGTVAAGSVQKLVFKFRIVRPKNWELHQHDG